MTTSVQAAAAIGRAIDRAFDVGRELNRLGVTGEERERVLARVRRIEQECVTRLTAPELVWLAVTMERDCA